MNFSFFKKIVLAFSILFGAMNFTAHAQINNEHFIYIVTKNKQPFYVILNDKVYSSSSIGYLLIPKLQSGTYHLKIGFPKQTGEQNYTCVVRNEDIGYSLQKNNKGKWGLLNLQSQAFITPSVSKTNTATNAIRNQSSTTISTASTAAQNDNPSIDNTSASATQPTSSFNNMLSSVANDSTLDEPIVTQQPQTTVTAPVTQTNYDTAVTPEQINNITGNNIQNTNSPVDETYGIIKTNEMNTSDGLQMTFVLFNSRATDTVQILIPEKAPAVQQNTPPPTADTQNTSQPNSTLPLFPNNDNNTGNTNTNNNSYPLNGQSVLAQCPNPLTEREMTKLQQKTLSKTSDDEKLSIIDKTIKGKCITTDQVRQLGGSFLSDAGRFALFQDAYSSVSDQANYPSLQNQLLDSYFKKRFTDMFNQ